MKIALVTSYTENLKAMGDLCLTSLRHFYGGDPDYVIFSDSPAHLVGLFNRINPSPNWDKYASVLAHLTQFNWVFWCDADSVCLRKFDFLEFIKTADPKKAIFLSEDNIDFCNGHGLYKSGPDTARILSSCLALGNVSESALCPEVEPFQRYDQTAMKMLYFKFSSVRSAVGLLPRGVVDFNNDSWLGPEGFLTPKQREEASFFHAYGSKYSPAYECSLELMQSKFEQAKVLRVKT